jgi:hypothetical protein
VYEFCLDVIALDFPTRAAKELRSRVQDARSRFRVRLTQSRWLELKTCSCLVLLEAKRHRAAWNANIVVAIKVDVYSHCGRRSVRVSDFSGFYCSWRLARLMYRYFSSAPSTSQFLHQRPLPRQCNSAYSMTEAFCYLVIGVSVARLCDSRSVEGMKTVPLRTDRV